MSYCVNCGVELDPTARYCPLCHTEVLNPKQPPDPTLPQPFPARIGEVAPVSHMDLALLISVMLLLVALCCGILNLFFLRVQTAWSLYVIGAAAMLWVWLVPGLLCRRMPIWLRLSIGVLAMGGYICLIAFALDGWSWCFGLALPIVLSLGVLQLILWGIFSRKCSILVGMISVIGAVGVFVVLLEFFIDRWLHGHYVPDWSLIVAAVCLALMIPLAVIRFRPALRDAFQRRFHF